MTNQKRFKKNQVLNVALYDDDDDDDYTEMWMTWLFSIVCPQELTLERQENAHLLKAHQDKDELIVKLKEEIDLLNRVRN